MGRLLILLVVLVVFGQRFGIPIGNYQLPIIVPLAYLALFVGFLRGKVQILSARLGVFLVAVAALLLSTVAQDMFGAAGSEWSATSLLFLIILYLPFVLVLTQNVPRLVHFKAYQLTMLVCAVLAIVQFIGPAFDLSTSALMDFIPDQFILHGYNYLIPISWGSVFYKANGFFFLEPSFLSRFLAVAILIELKWFQRVSYIVVYLIAMILTFSGTGFLLLAVGLLVNFVMRLRSQHFSRRSLKLLFAFSLLLLMFFLSPARPYFFSRLGEFANPNQSAHIRFIAPYKHVGEFVGTLDAAWGKGPGYTTDVLDANNPVLATAPVKLVFEYGFFAALIFLAFFTHTLLSKRRLGPLPFALLFSYLFLSGALLEPSSVYLALLLVALSNRGVRLVARERYALDITYRTYGVDPWKGLRGRG